MENEEKKKLKALLEQNYVWPAPYQFKFIVKKEMLEEIQELLCPPEFEVVTKESRKGNKKNKQSNFAKLSIFQPNKYKFKKNCPLSIKGAPMVDYKNIKLLKKYTSENGKILPSRITNVSQKKQRELSLSIKRARNLALI